MTIEVIPIPTEVYVFGDVKGRVLAIQIGTGNVITYQVVIYDQGKREMVWVEEWEVRPVGERKPLLIGFKD